MVSSTDILAANKGKIFVTEKLAQIYRDAQKDLPYPRGAAGGGFAFKLGVEMVNELKNAKILAITGGNTYLLPKFEGIARGSTLMDELDPKGLVSEWKGDGPLNSEIWGPWVVLRHELAVTEFKREQCNLNGKSTKEADKSIAELRKRLKEVEGHARREVSPESVNDQAINDLELSSYDSHNMQYVVVDGHLVNIDCARTLPHSEILRNDHSSSSGSTSSQRTNVILRSAYLDHAHCFYPIPEQVRERILTRDLDAEDKALRNAGLVGSVDDYRKLEQGLLVVSHDRSQTRSLGRQIASHPQASKQLQRRHEKAVKAELEKLIEDTLLDVFENDLESEIGTMGPIELRAKAEEKLNIFKKQREQLMVDISLIPDDGEQKKAKEAQLKEAAELLRSRGVQLEKSSKDYFIDVFNFMIEEREKALADFDKAQSEVRESMDKRFLEEKNKLRERAAKRVAALSSLAEKYGVPESTDLQNMTEKTLAACTEKHVEIKGRCYSQIHPMAYESWRKRAAIIQQLVKSDPKITMQQLRDRLCPELQIFYTVVERLEANPSQSMAYASRHGQLVRRSLESVIDEAQQKRLATPKEIQQMKSALAHLRKTAPPMYPAISTIMG